MKEDILIVHDTALLSVEAARAASRKIIKEPKIFFKAGFVVIADEETFHYQFTIRNIDQGATIHQFIHQPKQSKILKIN